MVINHFRSLLSSSTLSYFILVFTPMLYRIASASSFNSFTLVNTLTLVWSKSNVSDYTTCRVVVQRFRSPCFRKLHESLNLEMADCEESLMCMANGKQQGRTVSVERSTADLFEKNFENHPRLLPCRV